MKFILKLFAAPIALALTIVKAFFSFVLSVSDVIFGLVSSLIFIAAVVLLVTGETVGGGAFMVIAFLVSPFGIPALAGWLVRKLDGLGYTLRCFIFS